MDQEVVDKMREGEEPGLYFKLRVARVTERKK